MFVEARDDIENRYIRINGYVDPHTLYHNREIAEIVRELRYRVSAAIVERIMDRIGPAIDEAIDTAIKNIPFPEQGAQANETPPTP